MFAQSSPTANAGSGGGILSKPSDIRKRSTQTNAKPHTIPLLQLLGSAATASAAQSFALNGNIAYTCDSNEISAIDISSPSGLRVVATASAPIIANSGDINCQLQRDTLVIFSDQTSSNYGNSPGFVAFSVTNPTQPVSILPATPIDKRFFGGVLYINNLAFVPTATTTVQFGWNNQYGDLLAFDLTNFTNPKLLGTLEPPLYTGENSDGRYGGPNSVFGVTQASNSLLYIGYSTSTGAANNGLGGIEVVDASNPAAMKIVGQVLIPGTRQSGAPLAQGTVGVSAGNNGGYYVGGQGPSGTGGNIVITTFDLSEPRQPRILSITTTGYTVGAGGGAAQIGPNQFAFAGVIDSSNNNVLLVVDITNPAAPAFSSIPISQPFTSMQVAGNVLYATLGSGGFAAYSIPGTSAPTSVCPANVDAMVLLDQGAAIPAPSFFSAKNSLDSYASDLNLGSDQIAVGSFSQTSAVTQTLTHNAAQAMAAINAIVQGGSSYIGAGIAAAQAELTGPRHNPAASQVLIVVSDGADLGAPNSSATLSAASAAKAAGIEIIAIQYGSGSSGLMQSIASSAKDFHQVNQ